MSGIVNPKPHPRALEAFVAGLVAQADNDGHELAGDLAAVLEHLRAERGPTLLRVHHRPRPGGSRW